MSKRRKGMIVLYGAAIAIVTYAISEVTVTLFSLPIVPGILFGDVCTAGVLLVIFAVVAWVIAKGH